MNPPAPHYLLFSETSGPASDESSGRWRFVLQSLDGQSHFEADDVEDETCADRLELLALIRGLEALDQPSQVTVITRRQAISSGLRFGLESWRENDWQWERYGQMTAVKNQDLWKRVDQAMQIHRIQCRTWKYAATDDLQQPAATTALSTKGGKQLRVDGAHTAVTTRAKHPTLAQNWRRFWEGAIQFKGRLHAALQVLVGNAAVETST